MNYACKVYSMCNMCIIQAGHSNLRLPFSSCKAYGQARHPKLGLLGIFLVTVFQDQAVVSRAKPTHPLKKRRLFFLSQLVLEDPPCGFGLELRGRQLRGLDRAGARVPRWDDPPLPSHGASSLGLLASVLAGLTWPSAGEQCWVRDRWVSRA